MFCILLHVIFVLYFYIVFFCFSSDGFSAVKKVQCFTTVSKCMCLGSIIYSLARSWRVCFVELPVWSYNTYVYQDWNSLNLFNDNQGIYYSDRIEGQAPRDSGIC
jgi:hypothetical protein